MPPWLWIVLSFVAGAAAGWGLHALVQNYLFRVGIGNLFGWY